MSDCVEEKKGKRKNSERKRINSESTENITKKKLIKMSDYDPEDPSFPEDYDEGTIQRLLEGSVEENSDSTLMPPPPPPPPLPPKYEEPEAPPIPPREQSSKPPLG